MNENRMRLNSVENCISILFNNKGKKKYKYMCISKKKVNKFYLKKGTFIVVIKSVSLINSWNKKKIIENIT